MFYAKTKYRNSLCFHDLINWIDKLPNLKDNPGAPIKSAGTAASYVQRHTACVLSNEYK